MAKAFYSMEEVCELLKKSQNDVKKLVQSGTLREFRDAGKIFFKAEDVKKLTGDRSANEDSGEIMLEAAAEPELETSSTTDDEGTSALGLSIEGDEPAPERKGPKIEKGKSSGIGVFDDDELDIDADPMAETQITAPVSGDQVSLEGSGSGSGLLDLTRESDDTSLGAELLDEIYPGEEEAGEAAEPAVAEEADEAEEEAEVKAAPSVSSKEATAVEPAITAYHEVAPVAAITALDASEGLFSGLMVGTLLVLVVAGSVVAGVLQNAFPDYARFFSVNFWYMLIGAVVVPILALLIGWVIGKASMPKR
jgi:hypothetical protein